jgi:hypothetical protein
MFSWLRAITARSHSSGRSTNETALGFDERQYDDGRGPCLDSAGSGTVVLIQRDVTGALNSRKHHT